MIQGILIWLTALLLMNMHPLHVSICDIEYQKDQRSLQISSRMFVDDLELALSSKTNVDNYFDNRDRSLIDNDLKVLLKEKLKLKVNGKPLEINYLGYEIENDVLWCYLEATRVKPLKSIDLEYTVLLDTFDDQFNLVHVRYLGTTKSLRFLKDHTRGTLSF